MAFSFQHELEWMWEDTKLILRPIMSATSSFKTHRWLGVRLDRAVHFGAAALIFLLAARVMARWKAAALTLAAIILKEAVDVPLKLKVIRKTKTIVVTMDSVWDVAAGVAGLAVAFFLARWLWRERRAAPEPASRRLPSLTERTLPAATANVVFAALLCVSIALVLAFEVAGGTIAPSRLPHLIGAALVVACCVTFGTANGLLLLMPLLPFANWIQRMAGKDKLNVSVTMLLALVCCEAVRRLKQRDRRLFIQAADWPLIIYSLYACAIIVFNCFRLGWSLDRRVYWLLPPFTGLTVYFLAKNLLKDERLLKRALALLGLSFAAIAVAGVVEFFVSPFKPESTPGSVFVDAPALAVYVSLVWPLFLALALGGGSRLRVLFWLAAAAGLAAVPVVYVRSCWAAAGCALVFLLVLYALRRDWVLGIAVIGGIVLAGYTLVWGGAPSEGGPGANPFRSGIVRDAASLAESGTYDRARGRVTSAANRIIERSPLLGEPGKWAPTLHQFHAINYGIPGTVLAVAALLGLLASGWAGAASTRASPRVRAGGGATASVLAAILHGIGWQTLVATSLQPFLWYILGLVPAAVYAVRAEPAASHVGIAADRAPSAHRNANERVMLVAMLASFAAAAVLFWLALR